MALRAGSMQGLLTGVVRSAARHARGVVWGIGFLTLALGAYTATHLGVNTDNATTLLNPDLPFYHLVRRFEERFPTVHDSLLVVVDAPSASKARKAAEQLAAALDDAPDVVRSVFAPAVDPFFEHHGLLFLSLEELDELSDQLVRLQPVAAVLRKSPHLPALAEVIGSAVDAGRLDEDAEELAGILDRLADATAGGPGTEPAEWESLFLREGGLVTDPRTSIIVDPILDFDSVLSAKRPIEEIRRIADEAGLTPEHGYRVRVTGMPALSTEEMQGLFFDVGVAGLFSFASILVILSLALGSWRIVGAAAVTLLVGLVWTAAIAAATVGRINVVSIAFAVLFLGLGVDFAIHLGVQYARQLRAGNRHEDALAAASDDVGVPLATCAVTTAVGFFSLMPADYRGVGELGWISGCGMFVILTLTLTLFPALLTGFFRLPSLPREGPSVGAWFAATRNRPLQVLAIAAVSFIGAVLLAPYVGFDSDVVKMRDPSTESVETWNDLAETEDASPWFANVVVSGLADVPAMAAKLEALPEVRETRSVLDFVPTDQEDKLLVLEDLALVLDVPDGTPGEAPTAEEREGGLHELIAHLARVSDGGSREAARRFGVSLASFAASLPQGPARAFELEALEARLLGSFPTDFGRLMTALDTPGFDLDDLPLLLRQRMLAEDGAALIQVYPREDLGVEGRLDAFADAVRRVAPDATGIPVNIVEFARATASSLVQSMVIALVVITALLLVLWRGHLDTLLALLPLGLAGAWTAGAMVLLDWKFNFVNVVVLPLIIGIGIDSAIHILSHERLVRSGSRRWTDDVTSTAVFFSAVSTLVSFGSLAFSRHNAVASLGLILVLGMVCTVLANLVVLPSVLDLRRARRARRPGSV